MSATTLKGDPLMVSTSGMVGTGAAPNADDSFYDRNNNTRKGFVTRQTWDRHIILSKVTDLHIVRLLTFTFTTPY